MTLGPHLRDAYTPEEWARWRDLGFSWRDAGKVRIVVDGPGSVTEEEVQARLAGHPDAAFWDWVVLPTVPSTQPVAQQRFRQGGRPTAVLADMQSAGRGRQGRRWVSQPGAGVHLSLAWRPSDAQLRGPTTLVAGVAVAEALETLTAVRIPLKWPNDGLIDGRKCFGILAEAGHGPEPWMVLGIGVNVNGTSAGAGAAGHLAEASGRPWNRVDVALALAEAIGRVVREPWDPEQIRLWLDRWRRRSATLGQAVTAWAGEQVWEGRAIDITEDGALLIETASGVRRVTAGEVTLHPPG
jgi:BirA family biotin operon repressor/biotin-[acetyl-CoA-carboxylase] ligase